MNGLNAYFNLKRSGFSLDTHFHAKLHEVTAIFGPSGSGKTTLLRCIAGLDNADRAVCEFAGKKWEDSLTSTKLPTHERPIGYVFQHANLFPHLTVMGNLEYGYKRLPENLRSIQPDQAIDLLGISHLLKRNPASLSGGEKQRVAIARALLVSPRLLLMDEPLAALDNSARQQILPYLETIKDQLKLTILYVSHALNEVIRLADHMVVMEQGKTIMTGSPSDILSCAESPLGNSDQCGVVIKAPILRHDQKHSLSYLGFADDCLCIPVQNQPAGSNIRCLIGADDVSLSKHSVATSSLNQKAGQILDINSAATDKVMVKIKINNEIILARIHQHACDSFGFKPGENVQVHINKLTIF